MRTRILKCLNFGIMVAVLVYPKTSRSAVGTYDPDADTVMMTNLNEIEGFSYTDEEMAKLKIWDNGIIPYFIDVFSFDKVLRDRIRDVFKDASNYGGVRFSELNKPPSNDNERYLFIINRKGHSGCTDPPYYHMTASGVQKVILGYDCMSYGDLASVTLSILGIPPEHNAPYRDEYVIVTPSNALPTKTHLFEKIPDDQWLFHDLGYDFDSATHFHFHKYTSNGQATIIPVSNKSFVPAGSSMGEPERFSYKDVVKMRWLYNYIHYKHGDINSAECTQLFRPGNISSYVGSQTSEEIMVPRSKPRQYTGGKQTSAEEKVTGGESVEKKIPAEESAEKKITAEESEKNSIPAASKLVSKFTRPRPMIKRRTWSKTTTKSM